MPRHLSRVFAVVTVLLGILPAAAFAQQGTTVSGRVTNDAQTPLQSVSVSIPTLGVGAITDEQGRYSFTVPQSRAAGQSVQLSARRIGFQQKSATITLSTGSITQDFALTATAAQLTGVVVTALSQQREKATIGTSQQQVSAEELTRVQTPSVISAISGKVSGLQISQSGNMGGSQRIVIRGAGSLLGENQPLFIVDGIPVSNAGFSTASASGGRDYGTAISDINMDDVASVTVLKGPNAAALYGSRASNGAVVITTKNARSALRGTKFSFTSRMSVDQMSIFPEYQNQYGQGFGGQFNYVNGAGAGTNDGTDESWGPKLDGRTTGCVFTTDPDGNPIEDATKDFAHRFTYDNSVGCDQFSGRGQPWIAHPNNVRDYFRTGNTISNNLTVSQSFENAGARLSVTRDDIKGVVPNSSIGKLSSALSANATIKEKLDVSGSLLYTQNKGLNRSENGYTEGNPFMTFTWFGRQVDVQSLASKYYNKDSPYGFDDGSLYNWNDLYHRNPYWQVYENPAPDSRDRIVGQFSANYTFKPWLTGVFRGGADNYRFTTDQDFAKGNIDNASASFNGAFRNTNERAQETNFEGILTARPSYKFLDFTFNLGGTRRHNDFYKSGYSVDGILVPGIYNLANAGVAPTVTNEERHWGVNSSYGSALVTVKKYWTVEVTGRNDWSSTLPKDNASYFYPSVSSALILSDMIPALADNRYLSYLKVRGGWTRVGSDGAPYQLATVYNGSSNKFGSLPLFSLANTSNNPNLKPERTESAEGGIELSLFDDRVTFDGTYYAKITRDQIIPLTTAPATGFSSTIVNAGQISNRGFEASITAKPVHLANGFTWNTTFNYLKNNSMVDALYPGVNATNLGTGASQWGMLMQARVGQPYGVLWGYGYAHDSATGKLLTNKGLPLREGTPKILGNVNPNWTGGWANELRYKSLALNTLIDIRSGGQNFSIGNWWGQYAGILASTLKGREIDWANPGIVVDGIDKATGLANKDTVTAEDYNHNVYPIHEAAVYNTGFAKLREVRLSWDVPTRLASKVRASQLNVAFIGRNLFTWSDFPNYDPENAANATNTGQGYDMGALPTNRSFGINFTIVP
jgi:TonB-linked SusC/RagA family outer membrane protein